MLLRSNDITMKRSTPPNHDRKQVYVRSKTADEFTAICRELGLVCKPTATHILDKWIKQQKRKLSNSADCEAIAS
jgi:hypothetical protein